MSLAVLVPYRPDSEHRERIYATTSRLWAQTGAEVVYADDGLDGELFSLARAVNRARAKTDADRLLMFCVDAVPPPPETLAGVEVSLQELPWTTVFTGQRRFTSQQTGILMAGADPGPPAGEVCEGREALLAVRADIWDDLRGLDERFVGWGPEDVAWHRVLKTVYPSGNDSPQFGRFWSLWHPPTSRVALQRNSDLLASYLPHTDPRAMREFYLSRESS